MRVLRLIVLPLAVYTATAVFITYPLITHLTTHLAGAGYGDGAEYARLGWWFRHALANGYNPFYQGLFGYPDGFFSAVQWAQPLIYMPIALLGVAFGTVGGYNVWILLEVILSGLTAYWLCLDLLRFTAPTVARGLAATDALASHAQPSGNGKAPAPDRGRTLSALIGGLIFMAFPAVQGQLSAGHVNPLSNYAVPIMTLCLLRIVTGRSTRRTALIGALAIWIMALGNFTFPAFALLPLVLFGVGYFLFARGRALFQRRVLSHAVVMFLGGAALIAPFYVPLAAELLSPNQPAYLQETGWVTYSTDPLAFVSLSPFTLWTQPFAPAYSRAVLGTNSLEGSAYLGLIAVILAVLAFRAREARVWIVIALGCMVLSLGPLLKWMDQPVVYRLGEYESNVVLPWAAFQSLPFLSATRTPGRFNIITGLALGVLAAFGLQRVLARIGRRWITTPITFGLGVLILLEYQLFFPFPTTPADIPAVFEAMRSRNDIRAVLHVPYDDPIAQKEALLFQTAHHKPLVAGYVSRRTPVAESKLAVLSQMVTTTGSAAIPAPQAAQWRAILQDSGIDVVVIHWELLNRETVKAWLGAEYLGAPIFENDRLSVYQVPRQADDRLPTAPQAFPIAASRSGWWVDPASGRRYLNGAASRYLYVPERMDLRFKFYFAALMTPATLRLYIDERLLTAWNVEPVSDTSQIVGVVLAKGFHSLRFETPEAGMPFPISPECIVTRSVQDSCWIATPTPPIRLAEGAQFIDRADDPQSGEFLPYQELNVRLGLGLSLRGYRVPASLSRGAQFSVETDWQASQRLPGDYHLFIHVLDAQGNQIAQSDAAPGQNAYSTWLWTADQRWIENRVLKLTSDTPPGTYRVFAGWYSLPDVVRIPVEGTADGARDGLVLLGKITIE